MIVAVVVVIISMITAQVANVGVVGLLVGNSRTCNVQWTFGKILRLSKFGLTT